ncbi:MAG: helix-turn-helix domain-containing protein [Alphaproteobacteria bacterium]|nr:helix-turn-helix domain-containing protein [Alphaproteobacteria bacterium]
MRKNYTLQSRAIERLEEKIRQKQHKDDDFEPKEPKHKQPSELLTTEEAAAYLKLKPNTLERWRSQYPHRLPFVKIGRTVKYRLEDLQAFISGNRQGS